MADGQIACLERSFAVAVSGSVIETAQQLLGTSVLPVRFDLQPVLASDLLLLRPLTPDDFEALYRIASDPMVWEQHPSKDRTERPVFRRWFEVALQSQGALTAVNRGDGEVIGTSRYVVRGHDDVEIGWTFLARCCWGGTWNAEMKRLMLAHAFASVGSVVFTVHKDNLRSQRAVERLGASRVETLPDGHGRGENVMFYLRQHQLRQV